MNQFRKNKKISKEIKSDKLNVQQFDSAPKIISQFWGANNNFADSIYALV